MKKILGILTSFDWFFDVLESYPHEEISRYPFLIDGKMSYELYEEHKDNVLNLINKIKTTCAKIRLALGYSI